MKRVNECADLEETMCLSGHARMRARQRGIRSEVLGLVQTYHDRRLHAGDGLKSLSLTRKGARRLVREGHAADLVRLANRAVLVVAAETGAIVTVLHAHGRGGRRYRKQWPTRCTRRRG